MLRRCYRVSLQAIPDGATMVRWANLIGLQAIAQLNERVVELARSVKVTRGRKLRVDNTVGETNNRGALWAPSDGRLLDDGVRVLTRLVRRAKEVLGARAQLGAEVLRSRTRSVRRLDQQL